MGPGLPGTLPEPASRRSYRASHGLQSTVPRRRIRGGRGPGGYGLHLLSHGPMMRRSNSTLLVPQKDMSDDAGVVLDDNLAATLNIPGRGLDHPDRVPAAAPRPDRVHHVLVTMRRAVGTAASRIVPVNDRMCRHLAGGRLRVWR